MASGAVGAGVDDVTGCAQDLAYMLACIRVIFEQKQLHFRGLSTRQFHGRTQTAPG
jgi:hypothetical protein